MRVLIADHDDVARRWLVRQIESLGHTCLVATDGPSAWEVLAEHGVDVVLTEWALPGIDGAQLCRQLKARELPTYTYFALVTSYAHLDHLARALRSDIDDYWTKPFTPASLAARLLLAERTVATHRRVEALVRATQHFATEPEPAQLLDRLAEAAVAAVGGHAAAIYLRDVAGPGLAPVASTEPALLAAPIGPDHGGAVACAVRTETNAVKNDYQHANGTLPSLVDAGVTASVAVPLRRAGCIIGALKVVSHAPNAAFTALDVRTLEMLVSLASETLAAYDRARLTGVQLAVRTAQHELNNRLALTVGWAELLATDPALTPRLQALAVEAQRGAERAAQVVDQLRQLTRLEEIDWGAGVGSTIRLGEATGPLPNQAPASAPTPGAAWMMP